MKSEKVLFSVVYTFDIKPIYIGNMNLNEFMKIHLKNGRGTKTFHYVKQLFDRVSKMLIEQIKWIGELMQCYRHLQLLITPTPS